MTAMAVMAGVTMVRWQRLFVGAAVLDPFGNILGLMFNRHYLEMVQGTTSSGSTNGTFIQEI